MASRPRPKPARRAVPPATTRLPPSGPAPTSAAATSPLAGAFGGDPASTFYQPDPGGESPLAGATPPTADAAAMARDAIPLEDGLGADLPLLERAAAEAYAGDDELAAEIARIRQIRKPLGAYSQKLALPTRPGYYRHWFNDVAGRVEDAKENGWAFVLGTDKKPLSRCVGSGRDKGALNAFAMEIPLVFWQEDQDARHKMASDRMNSLKSNPFPAAPGVAKATDKGKFYDPSEASSGPLQIEKGGMKDGVSAT